MRKKGLDIKSLGRKTWKEPFLKVLRECGNVFEACKAVKINRLNAYRERKNNPDFAEQWQEAIDDACDTLALQARKRALTKSDTLMIFLLKCHQPDFYNRDRLQIQHSGEVNVKAEFIVDLTGGKSCDDIDSSNT